MLEDDFSLEDNKEVQETFSSMASTEFELLKQKLKYEKRRAQVLYMRGLSRNERKELKVKYKIV